MSDILHIAHMARHLIGPTVGPLQQGDLINMPGSSHPINMDTSVAN